MKIALIIDVEDYVVDNLSIDYKLHHSEQGVIEIGENIKPVLIDKVILAEEDDE